MNVETRIRMIRLLEKLEEDPKLKELVEITTGNNQEPGDMPNTKPKKYIKVTE